MQALTKEQIQAIIKSEVAFINMVFGDPNCEDRIKKGIKNNEFPYVELYSEVDHDARTRYVLSLEVRDDLNVWGYPEAIAVDATSGTLCGSCWAEYGRNIDDGTFGEEVQNFLTKVMDWINNNIEYVESEAIFSKAEEQAFTLLGY